MPPAGTGDDNLTTNSRLDNIKRSDLSNPKQCSDATDEGEATPEAPWKALFFFTTRANLPVLIFAITVSVLAGALEPAKSYLMGKAFGGFTSFAGGKLSTTELMELEKKYVLYLVIVGGASWLAFFLELASWLAFGELQAKGARDRLFHGLLKKDIEWYDLRKNGIGALLPRIQAQVRELQLATSQPLGSLFNLTSISILSLIQALVRAWDLTLVCLASAPFIMFAVAWVGGSTTENLAKQQEKLTEAQKFSTSALSAIETVKCFNGQEVEREKYTKCVTEAARFYYRVASANALQMALIVLLSVSMFVQGFYYGSVLVRQGKANASDVITTFFSAVAAFQSIVSIMPQLMVLEKGKLAGSTLRTIMAEVLQTASDRRASGLLTPRSCEGSIDVRNVSFSYPSRPQQLALDNVTMFIPAGDLTFVIGASGSGKSTIGQLLMQFYTSYAGCILLDGTALESLNEDWLRQNITLVEQTSTLFNDTMFQNIAYGKTDQIAATKEEVSEAAQFALLQLTINDLPNGLDTMVGWKGNSLSGGQRQRMALARARLRDSPILLLDESTSALDQISRSLMMDAIRHWRKGKTTIIITHDISQILPDDYAYLLENGRVVQDGFRKHMEKTKDSPFQKFLPPELRAETSPVDVGKLTFVDSIRTRGSSLDVRPHHTSQLTTDPLEAHLDASESANRNSFLPKGIQDSSPLLGLRGRANGVMGTAFSSPWMRLVASPDSPTPSTPSSGRWSGLWSIKEQTVSPPWKTESRKSQRMSQLMEQLVDRTGQLAAESRIRSGSIERKPAILYDPESSVASVKDISEGRSCLQDESVTARKPFADIMKTLWPSINWPVRVILILGFWGATMHAVCQPVLSFVLAKLFQTYAVPGGQKRMALIYSMIVLAVAIVEASHVYVERMCLEYVSQRWVDNIRAEAMKRVLDQPREFFDKEENAASRITGSLDRNAEEMRNLLGRFCGMIWIATLMVAISLIWAAIAQWKMTLIALSIAPYFYAVTKAFSMVSERWESHSNSAAEDAATIFTETLTNIKTVRALTLERRFVDKYVEATNHALRIGFQRSFYSGFFFGLSDSAEFFSTALIFYVGAVLVRSGASVPHIIQVFTMLIFAVTSLGSVLGFIPQIGSSKDTASRILRLAQLPDDSHEHNGDTRINTVGDILFNGLRFAYPSRLEHTVLHDVNLHLQPGSCTAIVGGSGSGKSTIANLLLKLYSTSIEAPNKSFKLEGEDLILGGRHIDSIDTSSLRSFVVPVSQTPTLFPATVAENIAYGLPLHSRHNSEAHIIGAAKKAGVHDFVSSLPQGYDTPLGDGGMALSGGQAQRIAIARALVRRPAVLILDEATSALDVESANLIRDTVEQLVKDPARAMSVIIITHSREMMEIAENIVVLDKGFIVEEGGFEELMARNSALKNLLSGGEWTSGKTQRAAVRRRNVATMKEVDWKRRRRGKYRK